MAESILSGKNGDILIGATRIDGLSNWTWTRKSINHAYHTNQAANLGTKRRLAGVKDSSGSFKMLSSPVGNTPVLNEGDAVTLILKLDSSTTYKTVPVMISDIKANCDIEDGKIIDYDVSFDGNGAYT